ncbi:4-hydroxy-3-methylbut-2-enyl diphosphate reductase [Nitrosococcus oceani]|uniref:4-hydroxy-3-methylbut-2-enyl diphosphate reductase n=2 Tax=Nitrosococcus oceani TaxID=1229 RepID=Q3JAD0_NITOC|nr:4-hydroxy-3-methylbut-2-enyl diphosphate reductase [Nitrosococcus oceani]ABA58216.1 4-hydroxy-3-methylbut-2-enyl diphosphate reductase [Nitrosococcus oceani ATCC 19707]KFI19329.1 4-hydroxy-3-methylbut-2-enyl diphosphate reductase [Nitrosococcus oceani C-27]KFI22643.1 4-hydroxy-3-methylbut-2-enyl diphosphate reductase [Nitrosococcus oceani]GEM20436.1 4-hydroxy-3-methylbut-2-enyl diphosphate reductase [Nitrosococcus oceani]
MKVTLAQPRGFCAGVVRAIDIVEHALEIYGAPIYVLHEIVHNQHVVEDLQRRGVIFTEDLASIPAGSVTIFSAHGVSTAVVETAKKNDLQVIDATCPLVTKVHLQAKKYYRQGDELIIIGHAGHPEVEGTRGRVKGTVYVLDSVAEVENLAVKDPEHIAYVTQTTLSIDDTRDVVDALKKRFPKIHGPGLDDICYATQNRQNAVREMSKKVDILLVVGARNSSNSNRLREVGEQNGITAHLIQDAKDLDSSWFTSQSRVGITAGASTPEILVQGVLNELRSYGVEEVMDLDGVQESISFRLPTMLPRAKLRQKQAINSKQ